MRNHDNVEFFAAVSGMRRRSKELSQMSYGTQEEIQVF